MAIQKKYKVLMAILFVITLLVLFYVFCVRIKHIKDGYVGVKSDVGGFVNDSASYQIQIVKGYVVYLPLLTEVYEYPTTVNSVDYEVLKTLTSDGIEFSLVPSLAYQVNDKKVDLLYRNYRKPLEVLNNLDLKKIVEQSYWESVAHYSADSLINNRNRMEEEVRRLIMLRLDKMGLTLTHISTQIEIPQSLKEMIDLRALSIQNALTMQKQLAEVDFQRKIDSLRFSALTPLALQKMFIDKWDGRLSPAELQVPSLPNIWKEIQKEAAPKTEESEK